MPKNDRHPDDPCGCGGGRTYGNCHGAIFNAPVIKAVPVAQAMYAEDWAVNAAHYQAQGLYTALAEELVAATEVHRVLDVGCGLGQGIAALAQAVPGPDRLIAGVDENPHCLAIAAERLSLQEEAVAAPRIRLEKLLKNRIGARPAPAPLTVAGQTVLIQADLMISDPAFATWLDQVGPLDAITMWFSGVHKARSMTKVAHDIAARSDSDLREALEDQVLELAAKHLREGGVLQMAQRGAGDMEVERLRWTELISGPASDHGLEVASVTAFTYEEPPAGEGMTLSAKHFDSSGLQRFVLSTVLRRRADA